VSQEQAQLSTPASLKLWPGAPVQPRSASTGMGSGVAAGPLVEYAPYSGRSEGRMFLSASFPPNLFTIWKDKISLHYHRPLLTKVIPVVLRSSV
jgi:hypothetical protein